MNALVCLLITALGSPHYRERDAAYHALAKMKRAALPFLERAAYTSASPEVRIRCQRLMVPYEEEIAERISYTVLPTSWPRRPWIYLYDGTSDHYLTQARAAGVKNGPPDWSTYREATRLWIRSQLIQRRPIEEITSDLDWMAGEERAWILQNGHKYLPPITLPAGYR